jgi:ribonuclease G
LEEFNEENTDDVVEEIAEENIENVEEFSDEALNAEGIDSTEESLNDEDSENIESENQTTVIEEEKPRQESYASAAAPDESLEPIARGFVPDDDSDDDANDAAGITRSEPMIDIDAWVSEVQDTVQKVEAVDSANAETVTADVETVEAPATSVAPVDAATAPAENAAPVRPSRGRAPHHSNRKDRNFKGRNNRQPRSEEDDEMMPRRRREQSKIEDLVKEGMEIIVQVAKDPIATKGARLTCHVSLPGRYLVFMPSVDHVGVSRRIESDLERRRLKEIIGSIRPEKTGVIVRTASGKQTDEKLKEDLDFIVQTWNEIQRKFKKQKALTVCPLLRELISVG